MDEHWKIVNSGQIVISTTPQELWESACSYFLWTDDNPIRSNRVITAGKEAGKKYEVEYKRPYSVKGFCIHCGISERYIQDIKESNASDSEWVMVMEKILYIIYTQNLEGAIVDLYNPIMVSKVLNMDKDQGTLDKPPRIEIVQSLDNKQLATSENEVLGKLDFEKVEILKDKTENAKRENNI